MIQDFSMKFAPSFIPILISPKSSEVECLQSILKKTSSQKRYLYSLGFTFHTHGDGKLLATKSA